MNHHNLIHRMSFLNHHNLIHRMLFLNHHNLIHRMLFLNHHNLIHRMLFLNHHNLIHRMLFLNHCIWDHFPLQGFLYASLGWTHSRMTPWCLLQLLCILCNSTEYTVSYVQLLQIATMRVAVRSGLTRGTLCASLHSVTVTHHMQEW